MAKRKTKADRVAELHNLADLTSQAAMTPGPGYQQVVLQASETIDQFASSMARKAEAQKPAVLVLPDIATRQELGIARTRQSVRQGQDVYLPIWSSDNVALPDAFLRSALFAASSSIQKLNDRVLQSDPSLLVVDEEVATLSDISLRLSGYRLCQYDRQVYAACLEYYRERPLASSESNLYIRTTLHQFAKQMGGTHNSKTYLAILVSLLRLSHARLRLRYSELTVEVPRLLSVSFGEAGPRGALEGGELLLMVPQTVAELFGEARWSQVSKVASDYEGLRGWLASFYASHSKPRWIPLETLYKLSGYESRMDNFRESLDKALEKLKSPETPETVRVRDYSFGKDDKKDKIKFKNMSKHKSKVYVVRHAWDRSAEVKSKTLSQPLDPQESV